MKKYLSRKFIISVAAFLGSLGASITALQTGNKTVAAIGLICSVLSAAFYAACEAVVDRANSTSRNYYGPEPIEDNEDPKEDDDDQ